MRKKIMWVISGLIVFGIVGFTVYQTNATSQDPDLNTEEISEFVRAQYPGEHTEPVLHVEDGEPVYQMEVTQNQDVYSLKVNGDTGKVIDLAAVERESTAQNQPEETEKDTERQEQTDNEDTTSGENNTSETGEEKPNDYSDNQATENNAVISHEEAIEIARTEFSGEVTDLEMDSDDDMVVYEIEMINGEDEATIEINAYTGNIVSMEIDVED